MKPVFIIKIFVDICMSALFLLLMSYHLLDDAPHEWIGAAVFLLFSAHNILNYRWYKNLFKGKYTAVRLMQTETNLLLWVTMLGCIVSSLCISLGKHVTITSRRPYFCLTCLDRLSILEYGSEM